MNREHLSFAFRVLSGARVLYTRAGTLALFLRTQKPASFSKARERGRSHCFFAIACFTPGRERGQHFLSSD
ncbi:MAG: hypothetical protein EAZ90_26720 [Oscillatoriales cyanobacterium]|nr:MAG: hypothetical protein EAZ94_27170 [Oscillatoriales cyanobacterium]TAE19189.1 MAG: hypothetical protein EAZ93_27515 [Oscillatoriales cyanobacterium]TAE37373.1 MAG: hypothetical protein EAZ90_26720 [Oscillatoriales cyanobacterium]TAF86274.1 MAG: hypothetical protein EAZ49_23810 [Oscillatoriales cyanobacterium]TAF99866.1 MAG: hypothetical protein EAZ45_16825 [Oscillatoriales cyanobacterium]